MIRKVTEKERKKAGNIYCSFCRPKKVDAVWRKKGLASFETDFACDTHKEKIPIEPTKITEADRQTWKKL